MIRTSKYSVFRKTSNLLRFYWAVIAYPRALRATGWGVFEPGVAIFLLGTGTLKLGRRVALGRFCEIQSRNAAIEIGEGSTLNAFSRIVAFAGVKIGKRCAIAQFVAILDHDHEVDEHGRLSGYVAHPIRIGDDVWIGDKATVLKGVTIGDRARVAAGAVVNRDVPAGHLAVGVPCRLIPPTGIRK